ncbi:MAG TPA: amidohydrolase family protein [Verrucomicrobiae bacterium]|jgi:predicted TIM-barrel fold metal-dependent hydrolase|nr:amidohydrolase family protein [Verrucomicrobiae bacterium]
MEDRILGGRDGAADPGQETRVSPCTSATSRRAFLRSAAALGVSAIFPETGYVAQGTTSTSVPKNGRIDVHNHLTPPILLQTVGAEALGGFAKWTPEKALAAMEESGVSLAMASVPPHYDPSTVDRIARGCNEYSARLAADHPGRFGVFAFLPMPHVDATLREIEYAFDTLKADGVGLYTNYGDKWLGDPGFDPVFEELNRRKAVVFTHPITANCCKDLISGINDGAIEWQTDTTRAIAQMIFGGAQERYPNVRVIFSHGGGTMPFLIERFTGMAKSPKFAAKFPQGFGGAAAKFYYDTAQVSNPPAMSALTKVVPMSQIVFGTDYPVRSIADHVKGLKECGVLGAQDLQKIDRENALALMPQFRT